MYVGVPDINQSSRVMVGAVGNTSPADIGPTLPQHFYACFLKTLIKNM